MAEGINMKKKSITVISITLLILLVAAICGRKRILDIKSSNTELYSLDAGDIVYSINEKGEKVSQFHYDKIKEILGADDKDDYVYVIICSDKIAICSWDSGDNSSAQEIKLYAVNESLGKSIELEEVFYYYDSVDYYKGDFYFTYDDKELVCSIKDSLEYRVEDADFGLISDELENKNVYLPIPYRHINGSITRLLDEVGYVISRDSSGDGYVMIQKNGTVTDLPQRGCKHYVLKCYDKNGVIFEKYFDRKMSMVDGIHSFLIGYYCIKLDTMEENKIPVGISESVTMKNGKMYWSCLSEQDKSSDISFTKEYYAYDVASNTVSVVAETDIKADVPPEVEWDIKLGELCVCGENLFIINFTDDKEKWFRVDKNGENALLTDTDLTFVRERR